MRGTGMEQRSPPLKEMQTEWEGATSGQERKRPTKMRVLLRLSLELPDTAVLRSCAYVRLSEREGRKREETSSMTDDVGRQLGPYRLLRLLGQGTFAAVYLGEHQYLERSAAIKVLHLRMHAKHQDAFLREAKTIAKLEHPHIIRVHDFGIQEQTPYLAMDYVPGGTLRQAHPQGSRLPLEQIVRYVQQIASALDYAHDQRVIHRDVK